MTRTSVPTGVRASAAAVSAGPLADTMLLFDWNGTIVIDSDRAHAALNGVLARRSLRILGEAEFARRFRLPLAELLERLGVEPDDIAEAEAEWNAGLAESRSHLRGGAAECLRELAADGAWLGVLTVASAAAVRFDQRALQVPPVWNSVEAGLGDTLEPMLRHRAARQRAYFVGDDADDLRRASAAGYLPVAVTDAPGDDRALRAAGAVHVIADLDELRALVAGDTPA
ncbi:HAD family hydrolase [Herbiconiux sp. P18]